MGRKSGLGLRLLSALAIALTAVLSAGLSAGLAEAASAKVDFKAEPQQVKVGDIFYVVCSVSSSEKFSDVDMELLYDAGLFQFVQGGGKVSGGDGVLRLSSTGNDESVKKRTFSLQFKALKAGSGSFDIGDKVNVTDSEGGSFSMSANLLTISVLGDESGADVPESGEEAGAQSTPGPTPEVVLSANNKLKKLSFNGLSTSPDFDPEVSEYTVMVDSSTTALYFNYVPEDAKSKVRLKNGEELITGENRAKVVVTAENGDKRVYKITVIKETEDETKVREQSEKGTSDITFSVYERKGSIFIQNQYQFEVVNVKDEDIIPSGYVKTSVELEGKSVPAYTMENDLENNYLLMYLKGAGKEPTLYQYDREEKTLQRYTGTMVQKVNQGGNVASQVEVAPNAWLYAVIVALMVLVLVLLIVLLNMILRKKVGKGRKELDDLDF